MTRNDDRAETAPSRRGFFRTVGLGAGAAATGLVLAPAVGAAAPAEGLRPDGSAGYRVTEHVERVYALSRF